MKRMIGVFVLSAGLTMFILPQVSEQFKPEPEGMYLVIASVCVGLLVAGLVGRKRSSTYLPYDARRLRLFLAENKGQSFTYEELVNMPSLNSVAIGAALADLDSQLNKGSSKDYKTTYTLKQ